MLTSRPASILALALLVAPFATTGYAVELERPFAVGGSLGTTCVNAAVPGTCLLTLRAAVELKFVELHLGAQPANYGDDNGPITRF